MADDTIDRRSFLIRSSRAALGGAALLMGCSDPPEEPGARADMGRDMAASDLGADMTAADMRAVDMGADMAEELTDAGRDMARAVVEFSKPPYLQRTGASSARLRFETNTEQPLEVRLERAGQPGEEWLATTDARALDYAWPGPTLSGKIDHPDLAGLHNLQEVAFDGLIPGEEYTWVVHQGDGVEARGTFVADVDPAQAFELGWIADTMFPNAEAAAARLATLSPDLVIHGGDLQYQSNPFDTWNGMFHAMAPLTAQAAFHPCVGNHEYEGLDEFDVQYRRLFQGHGEAGSTVEWAALTFGGVRFLLLNSEIELANPDSTQHRWMIAELEAVAASSTLRHAVIAFHRPYYTFSKSRPDFQTRDILHPIFQQYGVPLVLTGHNHCHERFEVDGITYVVDGGGGAGIYNPDDNLEDVLAERPEDEDLRKTSSRTHGVTTARFATDGTITLRRHETDGAVSDEVTIG